MGNDYDDYAYLMLLFVCDNCEAYVEAPEWFEDCDEEYCYYIARKAESEGWYIGFGEGMPCLCPSCKWEKQSQK
jgi:hypothetical protein